MGAFYISVNKAFLKMLPEANVALLLKKDPVFKVILETYGMPGFPSRPQGFESMCRTILEQQVSLDSARASYNKLKAYVADFTPNEILRMSLPEFRSCGISRQKASYLSALAQSIIKGNIDFEGFAAKSAEQVRQELIQVKGIGNWTIDVYLMFSLRSPDILPLGDIGIISAIKDLWGLKTLNEMVEYSSKWAPCRTTAAFFLWHYYLEKRGRKFPY